jgi:hypothetical protein
MSGDAVATPRGLPEPLPEGEHILWQGSPRWQSLAVRALHLRKLAIYFGILLALRAGTVLYGGGSPVEALIAVAWLLPLVAAALGMVALLAWLMASTAIYTITDRRVVMRIGVVLSVSFNLPFREIDSAALCAFPDGSGDISLLLDGDVRIAFLQLWPHSRPWHIARPEPTLRAISDAPGVATLLSRLLATAAGTNPRPVAEAVAATPPLTVTEPVAVGAR